MIGKWIGGLCLLMVISIAASAQILEEDRGIIYLHDGSVFIGKIIAETDLEVTMQVVTTDIVTVNKGLIDRIFRSGKEVLIHRGGRLHYNSGIFFSSSFGAGGNENASAGEWDFILGKRLNKQYSVGIGTALSFDSVDLPFGGTNPNFMPVFGYGRYYITHNRARVFGAAKLGWGFPQGFGWEVNHAGGLHFQPSIGVHFSSKKARRLIITLSQNIQKTKGSSTTFDVFSNPVNVNYNLWLTRTLIKIGVEFR